MYASSQVAHDKQVHNWAGHAPSGLDDYWNLPEEATACRFAFQWSGLTPRLRPWRSRLDYMGSLKTHQGGGTYTHGNNLTDDAQAYLGSGIRCGGALHGEGPRVGDDLWHCTLVGFYTNSPTDLHLNNLAGVYHEFTGRFTLGRIAAGTPFGFGFGSAPGEDCQASIYVSAGSWRW